MSSGGDSSTGNPPPPVPINHRTTAQIIRQSFITLISSFPTIFFLSLLLLSFRSVVENGTVIVTSFIDHDPSLQSLLSRLDIAGKNLHPSNTHSGAHTIPAPRQPHRRRHHHYRRRPFLHLTRVGTLDEDFFSGDDDDGRSVYGSYRKSQVNGSLLTLSNSNSDLGFSKFVVDNGIRLSEVVRAGVSFQIEDSIGEKNAEIDDGRNSSSSFEVGEGVVDLRFFMAGLELGRRDAAALFFLIVFLSAAYGWVIVAFVITYSWVLGIVFVAVLNDLVGRYSSFTDSVWCGSRLGLKKLSGFIVMKWAVRDALTQVLGLWFFGEIEDQYSFLKLILRLKLMPFSTTLPWMGGYKEEVAGFLFAWFFMDALVAFVFSVDSWVTIVSTRRRGTEIVKEGCNLLCTMFYQAIQLKCLEIIVTGSLVRWVLGRLCGKSFVIIFQSLTEIYFMVAWLIFYLSAKSRDASLSGRRTMRSHLVLSLMKTLDTRFLEKRQTAIHGRNREGGRGFDFLRKILILRTIAARNMLLLLFDLQLLDILLGRKDYHHQSQVLLPGSGLCCNVRLPLQELVSSIGSRMPALDQEPTLPVCGFI
ncbi:hypothetical protein Dimus_007152 [Dionaea muscipula]